MLLPLVRAACDERFNLHGVQATTHFAAPLIIVNGPIRQELGFCSRQNVFSNVARANSTLGRALQLILRNLGGARPDRIDMSTLGNPGKFSFCIAENEEENPWQPLHVDHGCAAASNAVTLFAGEAPHGVSEHTARRHRCSPGHAAALATAWSYRSCLAAKRSSCSVRSTSRPFIATAGEGTAPPVSLRPHRRAGGYEPTMAAKARSTPRATPRLRSTASAATASSRRRRDPSVVAGGTAGKFSAVIGSWSTGPRGSQMVTYGVE